MIELPTLGAGLKMADTWLSGPKVEALLADTNDAVPVAGPAVVRPETDAALDDADDALAAEGDAAL